MARSGNEPYRVARMVQIRGKGSAPLPGPRRRFRTLADQERAEARRKWLLISGAIAAALVAGVVIGRFLLP